VISCGAAALRVAEAEAERVAEREAERALEAEALRAGADSENSEALADRELRCCGPTSSWPEPEVTEKRGDASVTPALTCCSLVNTLMFLTIMMFWRTFEAGCDEELDCEEPELLAADSDPETAGDCEADREPGIGKAEDWAAAKAADCRLD